MKIAIKGIEVLMFLGIYKQEKLKQTKVLIDLNINLSKVKLKQKNNLLHLVDYDAVASQVKKKFEGSNYDLIEDLIFDIHAEVRAAQPNIEGVLIKVYKFDTHNFISHVCIEKEFNNF